MPELPEQRRDGPGGSLMASLLPPGMVGRELLGAGHEGGLLDAERPLVEHAVAQRRREFATARRLARSALQELGAPPAAVLPGLLGEPIWPEGITGSITHCAGYTAAVVAPRRSFLALGIDAEPDLPLPEGVAALVLTRRERERLGGPGPRGGVAVDRLLFCVKEAAFKAWSVARAHPLEAEDIEVTLDAGAAGFVAEVTESPGARVVRLPGRWARRSGVIACVVWTRGAVAATLAPDGGHRR